jgi:hypothetical protein
VQDNAVGIAAAAELPAGLNDRAGDIWNRCWHWRYRGRGLAGLGAAALDLTAVSQETNLIGSLLWICHRVRLGEH